ncbi:hypothetical protein VFPPC_18680 [Pochonia chlamydosporia 170]|uniref:Uncharacterized protein n=1 Tax=Pochonia chlamydosporia 170 TaxID=1380566 RepID=A0A219AS27_METCM|nr:hypothetical protein VFPPC_18680 [Pochonia chlamydosporia 170]OWT43593.1 hypothetical protein VFPPC_18680 [Pochonia chlamydosporia 170]
MTSMALGEGGYRKANAINIPSSFNLYHWAETGVGEVIDLPLRLARCMLVNCVHLHSRSKISYIAHAIAQNKSICCFYLRCWAGGINLFLIPHSMPSMRVGP